ncbi:MAG: T9SS type A sorting domain-containing protein [Bacteroidia bacterium]|nr:T9SS type A sorting domain-containing protein [Bacteroidia bacterium]
MKKTILLLTLIGSLCFLSNITNAQTSNWLWAKSTGSISNEYSNATCTDLKGNVYITGTFQGTAITFGSYTLNNKNAGTLDIFVVKYDANGNVLWAKSGGGNNYDYAYGICTDANDNVYIEGYFESPSILFDMITLNNFGSQDVFLVKYDSVGNVQWAKNGINHNGASSIGWGICSDALSNVYIFVSCSSSIIFDQYTLSQGAFIVKYNKNGNIILVKKIASGLVANGREQSICTDISGNIYITGGFQNLAIFGNDTLSGSWVNIFIAKYDAYGNYLWAKGPSGESIGSSVSADANGNIYLTGYFGTSVAFGSDTLAGLPFSSSTIFVAKYDSNGNALWGRSPGGTNSDFGQSICTDLSGNIFVTGYFTSPYLNFGGIPVINNNVGNNDIFIAEYDANGNALFAQSIGEGSEYGMGVCADRGNNIYLTGYFGNYTLNFGSNTLINNGSYDTFLAKLSTLVGINEIHVNEGSLVIYPNPAKENVMIINPQKLDIEILNLQGQLIKTINNAENQTTIDISALANGIYFIKGTTEKEIIVKKLIKE